MFMLDTQKDFILNAQLFRPREDKANKVALSYGRLFSQYIGSSLSIILRPVLHIHSSITWWTAR
jgi:hypothetical protein